MTTRVDPASLILLCLALLVIVAAPAAGQEAGSAISLRLPDRIRVSERSNLSARENGRYAGLLNRQVTGYLTRAEGTLYDGRFFLYEQVRRDMQQVARPIDRSLRSTLTISRTTIFENAHHYPSVQHLLSLPEPGPSVGDRWRAPGWISINPRRDDEALRLPVVVEYRFVGTEIWNGTPATRIEAQFATRYPLPRSDDPDAPMVEYAGDIVAVQGSHRLTIMLPEFGDQIAFVRDEIEELYRFAGGAELVHQGHTLLFLTALDVEEQIRAAASIERSIAAEEIGDVTVERTTTGVRMTIHSLRFLPDQAVLLPEERPRLDSVAAALRTVEGARLLVVGHTADVGSAESQDRLAVERARLIASELAARGIERDRIDVEGRGGREPLDSNETEDGRARNRRVEILIVEN